MSTDDDTEPLVSRRDVLRAGAASATVGTAAAGTLVLSGVVAADHGDAKPASVTLTYDESYLRQYRPMLDITDVDTANRPTLRGWVAASTDEDTTICVYVCEYAKQEAGWMGIRFDMSSHSGDHEWIYAVVDDTTGEVTEVVYTAYHWFRGRQASPTIYEDSDGPHPVFKVDGTYHHYYPVADETDATLLDVESLGDYESRSGALYNWLKNGMEVDLRRGAVHNPYLMVGSNGHPDWWSRDGWTSYSSDRIVVSRFSIWSDSGGRSRRQHTLGATLYRESSRHRSRPIDNSSVRDASQVGIRRHSRR